MIPPAATVAQTAPTAIRARNESDPLILENTDFGDTVLGKEDKSTTS